MRILIVEDEKKIAAFLKRGFKEEGYVVEVAEDGLKAQSLAEANEHDLIILDIMIPGQDGLAVCRKLREKGNAVPIIMLTAKDQLKNKVEGLDAGADDYVTKPFAFEELLARVRAVVRKAGSGRAALIKADDFEIDPVTHKVKRGGVNIDLTSKEYALLEYLARNNGKVITRTMISEHVWDIDFDTGTNIIDVYINYLRKKVDSGHSKKLIQTMRGRGYRFGL